MSMRTRAILLGVGFLVLVVLWFLLLFRPNQTRIDELREQQEQTRAEIASLEMQLQRLQELQRQEPQLRAELARMQDALPDDPRVPDFILQIHEAANLAGIDFLSITPSLPAPYTPPGGTVQEDGAPLQAISVSIATTGRYFALEDFIIRLERLRRAVRVNSFTLSPTGEAAPGTAPTLSVTFSMQMFVTGPAPPPTEAAPPPEEVEGAEAGTEEEPVPETEG